MKVSDEVRPTSPAERPDATVQAKERWVVPEITSFTPVSATRGISSNAGDGLNNQS